MKGLIDFGRFWKLTALVRGSLWYLVNRDKSVIFFDKNCTQPMKQVVSQ